jgi:Lon protease-like protein
MSERSIPLFPLAVVLLPGMLLPLRIFEPRYVAMVRDCTRDRQPFGVICVQRTPDQSDAAPVLAQTGTLAHIIDFYNTPDGLLGISSLGGERFVVRQSSARADGLLLGTVELLSEPEPQPLAPEFGLLGTLINGLVEHMGGHHAQTTPAQRDDAGWVSWRLTEFLPLELAEKQALLQMDDPQARLRQLLEWLPRFQSE